MESVSLAFSSSPWSVGGPCRGVSLYRGVEMSGLSLWATRVPEGRLLVQEMCVKQRRIGNYSSKFV